MIYKKGTIVPRRIIRCKHRKTQHLWTFGSDVKIVGRTVTMLSEGIMFCCSRSHIGGKKGKPRVYNIGSLIDVHLIGFSKEASIIFGEGKGYV